MEFLAPLFTSATIHDFVSNTPAAWPIFEIIHFFGMALLFGTVGLLDLRLLGVAKQLPVAPISSLVPLGVGGFIAAAITGYIFIASSPGGPMDYLGNVSFLMKSVCLVLAGVNVLAFHLTGVSRAAEALGPGADAPQPAKIIAACSLVLWIGVIYFGRMLMYADSFYVRQFYPF